MNSSTDTFNLAEHEKDCRVCQIHRKLSEMETKPSSNPQENQEYLNLLWELYPLEPCEAHKRGLGIFGKEKAEPDSPAQ